MSHRFRHLFALLGACGVLALAGCGSSDDTGPGFPPDFVRQLSAQLDLVQERLNVARDTNSPGSCTDIETKSFPEIQTLLTQIPDDTDPELRDALDESLNRLRDLTDSECGDVDPVETETTTTEAPPEETNTEETTPETDTAPTETVPPEEEKPKTNNGNGNGNGNGSGGTPPGQGGSVPAPLPGADG